MSLEISIVIPAYNEEGDIDAVVRETQAFAASHFPSHEILVVDDGSTDRTFPIAAAVAAEFPRTVSVVTKSNGGIGSALKAGFSRARGRYFIYSHGDGQFDFSQSGALIDRLRAGADVSFGAKADVKNYTWFRKLNSYGLRFVLFVLFGIPFWDVNFVHAYTREAYGRIVPDADGVFYHAEIIIRARWNQMCVDGVPVRVRERMHGVSHGATFGAISRTVRDLLAFRWRTWFSPVKTQEHDDAQSAQRA